MLCVILWEHECWVMFREKERICGLLLCGRWGVSFMLKVLREGRRVSYLNSSLMKKFLKGGFKK